MTEWKDDWALKLADFSIDRFEEGVFKEEALEHVSSYGIQTYGK